MNRPLISVVIPVFNFDNYLEEAVRSVQAQTYRPVEIIVVDHSQNGIRDAVLDRIRDDVSYVCHPPESAASARNRGVAESGGTYLAFLDADDRWTPEKLAVQYAAFEAHPETDLVSGRTRQFFSPDLSADERRKIRLDERLSGAHVPGAMLVKRPAFDAVGSFDPTLIVGETLDWFMRATEAGLLASLVDDVVLERRVHSSNIGRRRDDAAASYLKVVKAALNRRRVAD